LLRLDIFEALHEQLGIELIAKAKQFGLKRAALRLEFVGFAKQCFALTAEFPRARPE